MIRRREILSGIASLAAGAAHGQAQPTIRRIAVSGSAGSAFLLEALARRLDQLGWRRGETLALDHWPLPLSEDRQRAARDALRAGTYALVVTDLPGIARQMRSVSPDTQIVVVMGVDPLALGLADSMSHPGRGLTGFYVRTDDIAALRLSLLRELAPGVSAIHILHRRNLSPDVLDGLRAALKAYAGESLLRVDWFPYEALDEVEARIAAMAGQHGPAIYLVSDSLSSVPANLSRIIAAAARAGLPLAGEWPYVARAGGLMSYSLDPDETADVLAIQIDQILRGASASDLPIEQPTRFRFLINLRVARALKLTVSPSLLARADEVIE